jgi:outer membrane protein OmpA-like peptidoglycan-associated protein
LNDGERDLGIVQNRATAMLSASYGLLPWLELSAQLPFVLWQRGEDPSAVGLTELAGQGLGTPVLQARLGVLSRMRRQPLDLAADLGVGLPIGTGSALAGDPGPRVHARMVAGAVLGWVQPSFEAGVLFRPSVLLPSTNAPVRPGASSEIRLGASLATTGKGARAELGWRGTFAPDAVSMELLGGFRVPVLSGLEAFVLGGPGLGGAAGTPLFRVLTGLTFREEPPPRISFPWDERADQELQLTLANPERPLEQESVRPVPAWQLNALSRGEAGSAEASAPPRPNQIGPQEKIVLRGEVHFPQGSAEMPGVVPLLDQVVLRTLEQATEGYILIEGHSDKDSADAYTAVRRAQAIRRYLISQGIPATRVRTQAFGSDWPVSSHPATEQERQLNRRAEVLVITESTPPPTTQVAPP